MMKHEKLKKNGKKRQSSWRAFRFKQAIICWLPRLVQKCDKKLVRSTSCLRPWSLAEDPKIFPRTTILVAKGISGSVEYRKLRGSQAHQVDRIFKLEKTGIRRQPRLKKCRGPSVLFCISSPRTELELPSRAFGPVLKSNSSSKNYEVRPREMLAVCIIVPDFDRLQLLQNLVQPFVHRPIFLRRKPYAGPVATSSIVGDSEGGHAPPGKSREF